MNNPWTQKTVLIVDDSPIVQTHLKNLFNQVGMTVAGVKKNGIEALEFLQSQKPDLVSIDIIMPEMDGIELFRKIGRMDPQQKVLFLSWLSADGRIIDNLLSIVPPHLLQPKPTDAQELSEALNKVFDESLFTQDGPLAAVGKANDDDTSNQEAS